MFTKITDSILYVGVNDREIDLFEGQYKVPNGMAYNSYVILDEAAAVMDTVDARKTEEWLTNLEEALAGRTPDYLVVQHMEPDHAGSIDRFVRKYPDTVVVGNTRTFTIMEQFFPQQSFEKRLVVKEGDSLRLGNHTLHFVLAPMVHWPEVMMSYEDCEKLLFSADAFGKFGALDVKEDWDCEARRYYIGIVGKYGMQVQNVLKKAAGLEIKTICPLHGPVLSQNLSGNISGALTRNLSYYLNLYDIWSSYRAESEGVCICYTSVYGHTREAVRLLSEKLGEAGVKTVLHDLAREDMAEAVEDAFRYDRLVLATTTYNAGIFPFMKTFLSHLTERNFQNRKVALIENGSWAPMAIKVMKEALQNSKDLVFAQNNVTLRSAMNEETKAQIAALAQELSE